MVTGSGVANDRQNYCYRHPDRQSFTLCQRCLRTICPQCQTPAPVGVICPDCLKKQQKARTPAQRKAHRRWGGALTARSSAGTPVTLAIIALTAFVGVLQVIPGLGVTQRLWFAAAYVFPDLSGAPFEPWRVLTAALVHGGFMHFALNMLALWLIGQSLEPALGKARFLTLYLLSAVGGSAAVAILAPNTPVVGASGAIFGLFGAVIVIGRSLGANMSGILIVVGLNLVIGFVPGFNISWEAHVGGMVTGALIGLIYSRTSRMPAVQVALLGLISVALVIALAVVPRLLLS